MKLFHFYRFNDESGVSGTGPVVEGVEFTNGWCAIRWLSNMSSMCFYQSIEEVKAIHSHGGKTEVVVHDFEPLAKRPSRKGAERFEILMDVIEEFARVTNLAEDPEAEPEQLTSSVARVRRLLDDLLATVPKRRGAA